MDEEKTKLLSNLVKKVIEEMINDYNNNIVTEYTLLIKQIISLYNDLYILSEEEKKEENIILFFSEEIIMRGNTYIQNAKRYYKQNINMDMSNKDNILNYYCAELINNYVDMKKLENEVF